MLVCMRRCVRYDVMNRSCDIVGYFQRGSLRGLQPCALLTICPASGDADAETSSNRSRYCFIGCGGH